METTKIRNVVPHSTYLAFCLVSWQALVNQRLIFRYQILLMKGTFQTGVVADLGDPGKHQNRKRSPLLFLCWLLPCAPGLGPGNHHNPAVLIWASALCPKGLGLGDHQTKKRSSLHFLFWPLPCALGLRLFKPTQIRNEAPSFHIFAAAGCHRAWKQPK